VKKFLEEKILWLVAQEKQGDQQQQNQMQNYKNYMITY